MWFILIVISVVQVATQRVVNFEAQGVNGNLVVGTPGGFDDASSAVFSTDHVYEGKFSAKTSIRRGEEGFGVIGGIINFPQQVRKGGEVWIRIRTYFPTGWSFSANPWLKFIRIHTTSPQNSNEGYDDWYINIDGDNPFQFIYEGEQVWHYFGTTQDAPKFDVWETYEMYVKFDSTAASKGGQALVRFWKNGIMIGETRDRKTLASDTTTAEAAYLFTYWNGGAPKDQSMYLDDIKIQFTRPSTVDSQGNPYIGMGNNSTNTAQPTAPSTSRATSNIASTSRSTSRATSSNIATTASTDDTASTVVASPSDIQKDTDSSATVLGSVLLPLILYLL